MRPVFPFAILFAFAIAIPQAQPQDDKPMKSALETDPKGWEYLPFDLDGWRRVPATPKGKLAATNPWSFDKEFNLHYDGAGVSEILLLYPGLKTNGIFHAEWRYKRPPAKGSGSGGILFRTSIKADVWHLAMAGNNAGGFFTGDTLNDGKPAKVPVKKLPGPTRVLTAPEWNVYEVSFKEKTVSLFVNGFTTAEWLFCDVPKGYIGLKSDGATMEFKNLKFKRMK